MDRDKVIKELESLRDICNAKSNMAIGKGKVAWAGYANTADDAIALIKEQEPPTSDELKVHYGKMYKCKGCGLEWYQQAQRYCQHCGQAVKWE